MEQHVNDEYRSRRTLLLSRPSHLLTRVSRNPRTIPESPRTDKRRTAGFHRDGCHLVQRCRQLYPRGTSSVPRHRQWIPHLAGYRNSRPRRSRRNKRRSTSRTCSRHRAPVQQRCAVLPPPSGSGHAGYSSSVAPRRPRRMRSSAGNVDRTRRGITRCRREVRMNR